MTQQEFIDCVRPGNRLLIKTSNGGKKRTTTVKEWTLFGLVDGYLVIEGSRGGKINTIPELTELIG